MQRERSLSGSLQSHDLIGHETVDEVERELVHRQFRVEQSLALVLVGTRERSHLLVVLSDDGIDIVRSVLLRHIDHLGPHVAHGCVLVDEVVDRHVARDGEVALRLHDVVVAVERARDLGREGQHRQHLVQFKLVHGEGDVLQHRCVSVVGVELHTRSVAGAQDHLGRNATVLSQIDIVVLVHVKRLVAENRRRRGDVEFHAVALHGRAQSQVQSRLSLLVLDDGMGDESFLEERSVDQSAIRITVAWPVVHRQVVVERASVALQVDVEHVDRHAALADQRIDAHKSVDARLGR